MLRKQKFNKFYCSLMKQVNFRSVHPSKGDISKKKFLTSIGKDFKKLLSQKCKVGPKENILCAFSGGHSSSAMMKLLKQAVPATKLGKERSRLKFSYSLILIDTSEAGIPNVNDDMLKYIKTEYTGCDNFHIEKLQVNQIEYLEKTNSDLTTKEYLLNCFIERKIIEFGIKNGYTRIFFGNSATRIAVQSISNICIGNALNVKDVVSLNKDHLLNLKDKIIVSKPMKGMFVKQIVYFNFLNNTKVFNCNDYSTGKISRRSGVEKVVEYYIHKCQKIKKDTTFTILRTGEKLGDVECNNCMVCSKKCTEKYCPICKEIVCI